VEQRIFTKEDRSGRLLRIISGENEESVLVHQGASVYVSALPAGGSVSHTFEPGSGGYLYLISGAVQLGDEHLATGDAARIEQEPEIEIRADEDSELIMVEVRLD
jgi:redox-sensitive bicupin YhaK (pirin superfamily)